MGIAAIGVGPAALVLSAADDDKQFTDDDKQFTDDDKQFTAG